MLSCHGRGEHASRPWRASATAVAHVCHSREKPTISVIYINKTGLLVCLYKPHCAVGIVFEWLHHYAALIGMSVGQSAVV